MDLFDLRQKHFLSFLTWSVTPTERRYIQHMWVSGSPRLTDSEKLKLCNHGKLFLVVTLYLLIPGRLLITAETRPAAEHSDARQDPSINTSPAERDLPVCVRHHSSYTLKWASKPQTECESECEHDGKRTLEGNWFFFSYLSSSLCVYLSNTVSQQSVHMAEFVSSTITAVKLWDASIFFGSFFSVGLNPRHVTQKLPVPWLKSVFVFLFCTLKFTSAGWRGGGTINHMIFTQKIPWPTILFNAKLTFSS